MQGSPAFTNGNIQVNDKLISIDGTQMGNMHLDKVFEMINGPAGRCACLSALGVYARGDPRSSERCKAGECDERTERLTSDKNRGHQQSACPCPH